MFFAMTAEPTGEIIDSEVATTTMDTILEFFAKIVRAIQGFLPLDEISGILKEKFPVLAGIDTPLIALTLAVLVVWLIYAVATKTLKKNLGTVLVVIAVIGLGSYMGYIVFS